MTTALAYLLAASAGAYLAGIAATLAGKWPAPLRVAWWPIVLALFAFVLDRLYPDIAFVAAPVIYVAVAAIVIRVVRAPHIARARNLLWATFVCAPSVAIAVVTIADFFPSYDTSAITLWGLSLLMLPGLSALVLGSLRLTSRSPRT